MTGILKRFSLNFVPIMLFCLIFANLSGRTAPLSRIYWALGVALSLALLLSFFLKSKLWQSRFHYLLEVGIKCYLSFFFMIYGAAKLSKNQFSEPETFAHRLLGQMELGELAWAFFSSSFPYTVFIGLGQMLGAFLLCFRRTTLLGASLLFVIALNVVMVNFFYDISVRLFSSVLLIMISYLLLLEAARLWGFFLGKKSVKPRIYPDFPEARWFKITTRVLQIFLILFITVVPIGMMFGN